MQGIVFNIKRFALHDGPGIRTTVFLKGCPQACWWCHNPEGLNADLSNGIGERQTAAQVVREIEKEIIFYDESGGGATFSGGEPLMQPEFLAALTDECRKKEIHIALDTTGCVSPRVFNSLMDKVDLFLYDLKIMENKEHIKYTGTSNQYVLKNLKTLSQKEKNVIIRFPMIPAITDTRENVTAIAIFAAGLRGIRDIQVLPFHRTAEQKYRRLNIEYKMNGVMPPTPERIREVEHTFETYGLKVTTE